MAFFFLDWNFWRFLSSPLSLYCQTLDYSEREKERRPRQRASSLATDVDLYPTSSPSCFFFCFLVPQAPPVLFSYAAHICGASRISQTGRTEEADRPPKEKRESLQHSFPISFHFLGDALIRSWLHSPIGSTSPLVYSTHTKTASRRRNNPRTFVVVFINTSTKSNDVNCLFFLAWESYTRHRHYFKEGWNLELIQELPKIQKGIFFFKCFQNLLPVSGTECSVTYVCAISPCRYMYI